MKFISKANRGKPFEEFLKLVHRRYNDAGIAVMRKISTEFIPIRNGRGQVVSCKVEEKSCVDYLGRCGNIPVAAEAKHSESDRISFARVEEHQAEFLDDWDFPGVMSLVLVSFKMERFFAVPWIFWKTARDMWKEHPKEKTEVSAYGWVWTTPGTASVKPEQLLPDWEVKARGAMVLPYMDVINKMKGA